MAGGAGARRGPSNGGGGGPPGPPPNQGSHQYQGPPPGHPQFNQYSGTPQGQQLNSPPIQQYHSQQQEKPRSGGYDGPGEPAQRGFNPYGPGLGYDPAKPNKPVQQKVITNTRIELPASAYKLKGGDVS